MSQRIIASASVVCCTCMGAGATVLEKRKISPLPKFKGVLIDEAAQATEISAVIAVGLGCEQLVLVRDLL